MALLCAAFLSVSLLACSDDDASFTTKEALLDAKKYGSLEELPACTDDLRGQVADVAGVYYACVPDSWTMVGEIVRGVCNIRACDAIMEGSSVLTVTGRQVYTCRAGSWIDSRGKSFSDDDYIECFIGSMIQDTVASVDSLDNCVTGKEGSLSVVMGGNLMACASRKWVSISDTVVSEKDLPKCSSNKKYVYVLSKVKAYECKDGLWYNGSVAVSSSSKTPESSSSEVSSSSKESSSSKGKDSSSSKKPESSSSVSSSSKTVSSSSIGDGVAVRGICKASVNSAEKGEKVTYSFYNLGGTPQTFNWIFGELANPAQSNEASPEVAYTQGGWHKAKLIVNEGMATQSDTVVCSGVTVHGTPITGCECTTDAKFLVTSSPEYSKAEWTVTGCSGAAPFTYEWSSGGVGDDSVGVGSSSWTGDYAPYVVVTNRDGEYMVPTCQNVVVVKYMSFDCSLTGKTINVIYKGGANSYLPSVDLSIASGDYFSTEITMNATDKYDYFNANGSFLYTRYSWYSGTTMASYTLDDTLSPLPTYAVLFAGDTVCTVSRATCGPTDTSNVVLVGNEASWSLFVDGEPYSASSYEWKIKDKDVVSESALQSPSSVYSNAGTVSATLTVDKGKATEASFSCADLTVVRDVTGCTCNGPKLLSTSNNLANQYSVKNRWWVTDCDNVEDELSFEWKMDAGDDFNLDPDYSLADVFAMDVGTFAPTVSVSNSYGITKEFTCSEARVVNVTCEPSIYSGTIGSTVTWSVTILGDYEASTYQWEMKDEDGALVASSTRASPLDMPVLKKGYVYGSLTLNKGLDDEMVLSCGSVFGKARRLTGCTCGEPELLSQTNNMHDEGGVTYGWRVTGCNDGGASPLSYTWKEGYTPVSGDPAYATATFTDFPSYLPSVRVENADGDTMLVNCEKPKLMDASCYPTLDSVTVGDSVIWLFQVNVNYDHNLSTYNWTVTDAENNVTTYDYVPFKEAYQAPGIVNSSVVFNEGTENEFSLVCSPLKVKPAASALTPITGCVCDGDLIPKMSPDDVSKLQWAVTGCMSEGATPLTYAWSDDVTPDPDDPAVATLVPTEPGTYRPTVTVGNTAGVSLEVSCREWKKD